MLRRILEKHGPFAAMLTVACGALYLCVVVPFQTQQQLLTESNRILLDNTVEQSKQLVIETGNANRIQDEQTRLLKTMATLGEERNDQLVKYMSGNREMLDCLKVFSEGVTSEHHSQDGKLDKIIEQTSP